MLTVTGSEPDGGWRGTSFWRRSPRSGWRRRGHAATRRCPG